MRTLPEGVSGKVPVTSQRAGTFTAASRARQYSASSPARPSPGARPAPRETPGAQQLDRAEGAGADAGRDRGRTAAGMLVAAVPGVSDAESDGAGLAGEAVRLGEATAAEAVVARAGAGAAGSASLPPPYIQVRVCCTAPGLSVIPETVAW